MGVKDIRLKTRPELLTLAAELSGQIRDLKSLVVTRQHKNVRELRHKKRELARVLTVLKQTPEPSKQ